MGLFDKRKERKEQRQDLMASVKRDIGLSEQVAAKQMGSTGMDVSSMMQAAQQAMQPGAAQAMIAQRDRIMRLSQQGIETPATLRAVQVGATTFGYSTEATLDWTVEPPGAAPYEARSVDTVHADMAGSLVAGARCVVRVDPADPQSVMFWGATKAGAAPAAPADGGSAVDRLTKLQELRTKGLITEEEFAAHKAEILGS